MKKFSVLTLLAVFLSSTSTVTSATENQLVAGAGPSTVIAQLFFEAFSKMPEAGNYKFEIPEKSVKHAGGIKGSDHFLFGRTGRPLNAEEKQLNKDDIFLAKIPIAIAVGSDAGVKKLDLQQLEAIVTGKYTNWKEAGGADAPIVNVGREETEALFSILKEHYPFYKNASFNKVLEKDNHVVGFIQNDANGKFAIAFGAEPNFKDQEGLNIVPVKDLSAGASLGLVYDLSNSDHPIVKAVKKFAASDQWAKIISTNGYMKP